VLHAEQLGEALVTRRIFDDENVAILENRVRAERFVAGCLVEGESDLRVPQIADASSTMSSYARSGAVSRIRKRRSALMRSASFGA
jgi:hypothetical protein